MNYSATQMAKKLDISRSYLYYLKEIGVIDVEINDKGHAVWSNAKINDEDIMRILSKKGTVKVFAEDYKAFSTGKSGKIIFV